MLMKTWREINFLLKKGGHTADVVKLGASKVSLGRGHFSFDICFCFKYLTTYFKFQNGSMHAPAREGSSIPVFKTSFTVRSG